MKAKMGANAGIDGAVASAESECSKLYHPEHTVEQRSRINRVMKFGGIEAALKYLGVPYGQPRMALAVSGSNYTPQGGGPR